MGLCQSPFQKALRRPWRSVGQSSLFVGFYQGADTGAVVPLATGKTLRLQARKGKSRQTGDVL